MSSTTVESLLNKSVPLNEAPLAHESSTALAAFADQETEPVTLSLDSEQTGRHIKATVPAGAVRVLAYVLDQMAQGKSVSIMPFQTELTTRQVAEVLGVSGGYVVKLLREGRLPYRTVGRQRRIRLDSLREYIDEYQSQARAALKELAIESQRSGLYE